MDIKNTVCEILAPAGSKQSAAAAINAGADAIYLGLDKFSARSSAENFSDGEFIEICKTAHAFGVKVYVALNTVVKDAELSGFISSAVSVWNGGADALIIQDLYLGKFLKEKFPAMKLHLSTQAGTCNVYGALCAKQAGFDRVILARETSLSDIAAISGIIETEAFVQGALCTCFSGQCYMSSFAGGNSGNRGRCKQPCRKKYSLDRSGFEESAYRLSLSDLCVGQDIAALKAAGVYSFKIEGRMRRPEYVAAAVGYYKNIASDDGKYLSALKRTYNRGNYTKGLAFGQDKSFVSSSVQGHIGEFAGIIKVVNAKYICQSNLKFHRGDGFKILRGGAEVGGGLYGEEVKGGFTVNSSDRLKNGDKVFITTDTELNKRLLSDRARIPLEIKLEFIAGGRASADVNGVKFYGDIIEAAKTSALTAEQIKRCFEKVDAYPFGPHFTDIKTENAFIPSSALNAFRRSVYGGYYDKIASSANAVCKFDFSLPENQTGRNGKTAVICGELNKLKADIGILKLNSLSDDPAPLLKDFAGEKFLYLPPYLTGEELQSAKPLLPLFDGVYCDGYYGRKFAAENGKKFFAGTGLNITNRISLSECGADYICLSKELTRAEADALARDNTFYLTAGNIRLMDLIYCPFEKKCADCDKRRVYTLTDGAGRRFPLVRYTTSECRFEVYNCADLVTDGSLSGRLFDCTVTGNANDVVACDTRDGLEKIFRNRTRGHYSSGIL